ncbi:hypothetical protein [Brucella tritici]|uniref:hypothetical protein n=1 Tax=Brucella tritici TaxID=94626 RepID=UPI002000BBEC|nr:hypothetical protein [Brucella tritici]
MQIGKKEAVDIYVGPDEHGDIVVKAGYPNGVLLGEAGLVVEFILNAVLDETSMKRPVPEWATIAAQAFQSTR